MSKSDKQRISEMIQQRIQQKKQRQLANRPRVPVLKVMFENAATANKDLTQRKSFLQAELDKEGGMLTQKSEALNSVANMLREPHTQITIRTDFYASEIIPTAIKEFYRKSSNNFLKMSIIQKRSLSAFKDKQNMVLECLRRIRSLEETIRSNLKAHRKAKDDQLVANMNQKLKYEDAVQRGIDLINMTANLHKQNSETGKEYEFKKNNLDNMEQKVVKLRAAIQDQIKMYQATYNVITYRDHLQKVFNVKLKIQCLQDKVKESYADITEVQNKTTQLQDSLERKNSFMRIGKIESLRTASKSMRMHSIASSRGIDRKLSSAKLSNSGMNTTGFLTDRAPSTGRKTRRSIFQ